MMRRQFSLRGSIRETHKIVISAYHCHLGEWPRSTKGLRADQTE
jgi:hypothetical protein